MGIMADRTAAINRILAAEARTIAALRVIADNGGEADQQVGLTYLGHLKVIRDRWPRLSGQVDTGDTVEAYNAAQGLVQLAATSEGLADAAESRSRNLSRRPPTHGEGEPLPPAPPSQSELKIGVVEDMHAALGVAGFLLLYSLWK